MIDVHRIDLETKTVKRVPGFSRDVLELMANTELDQCFNKQFLVLNDYIDMKIAADCIDEELPGGELVTMLRADAENHAGCFYTIFFG